ncbi:MAG TPA: transcriptional repressor NrdR [Proteobacteria bacterium]|nr:transcriptional repressor NrdR [bacterium BMS3Abin14]HDL52806.1 transcriptional repressor NrdR [Pseudomonadota bacterium]
MKCPFCSDFDNKVVDSRLTGDSDVIRRRRECLGCGRRFTTYERVEDILPMVIKKDGRREPFERAKILSGIQTACQKRPISVQMLEEIVDRIEKKVQENGEKEIKSSTVGETVMQELHDLDEVAYVRFASVYRSFKDINEFMDELKDLLSEEEARRLNGEKTKK